MTNAIVTGAPAPALFPLPIFIGIALAVVVGMAILFLRHWRRGKSH